MLTKNNIPSFRLLTLFFLSFLFGIGIASFFTFEFGRSWPIFLFAIATLLMAGVVNVLIKNYFWILRSFSLLFVFLGLFYYSHFEFKHQTRLTIGQETLMQGSIVEKPERDFSKQRVLVEVENGSRVLVSLPHYPYFEYGDHLKFRGKIEPLEKFKDYPGYQKLLKRKLIGGVVNNSAEIEVIDHKKSFQEKFYSALYATSDKFENTLNRLFHEPQASLANGILLGLKKNLTDDFMEALNATGLTHLIALSGYNVTIIVSALSFALAAYLSRRRIFMIGSGFVILFVLMTGASSSVVRAAIFSLLLLFGKTIGRKADFTNLLLLAAVIMVLSNPLSLRYDVGFQLSFLAFSGLIYLSPVLSKLFSKKKYQIIPESIKSTLVETLSAQIAVLPLILHEFGRLSLIAPLSNILVLWIVPYAMLLIFITGLFGIIWFPIGKAFSLFAWPFLAYIVKIPEFLAKFPLASFEIGKGVLYLELLLFAVILIMVRYYYKKFKLII